MTDAEVGELLDRFGGAPTLADRSAAATRLLDEKLAVRHSKDFRFADGLAFLQRIAAESSKGEERLAAIGELVRIGQVVRTLQRELPKRLAPAFAAELPPVRELKNSDGRFYVARGCAIVSPGPDWLRAYAATAAVEEEGSAAKIRGEFLDVLVRNVQSVAQCFHTLAEPLKQFRPARDKPGDSMGRRLVSVLSGLRPLLVKTTIEPGESVGSALTGLLKGSVPSGKGPESESVRFAVAEEVILTVFDIVRTRFSVSSDADTYAPIRHVRRMFEGTFWPSELRKPLDDIQTVVSEAILLLGKQDRPDATLMEVLELICGIRERSQFAARALADGHPELPERVKTWLRTGRLEVARAADADLVESGLQAADSTLASVLLELDRLRREEKPVKVDAVSALAIYEPRLKEALGAFLGQVDDLGREIENLAAKRRLGLHGVVGERIEFAPKYFEFVGTVPKQEVVVIRSAVVRLSKDDSPGEAVLKGLVE